NHAMRKKLILYFKRRNHARKQWEQKFCQRYDQLMEAWEKKVERIENNPRRRAKESKVREYYEKQFPEIRKQREMQERMQREEDKDWPRNAPMSSAAATPGQPAHVSSGQNVLGRTDNYCGLHQPSREAAFPSVAQCNTQTDHMEQQTSVGQSYPCNRSSEPRSGYAVQGHSVIWSALGQSSQSGTAVVLLRVGNGGPIRLRWKCSVTVVLLDEQSGRATKCGCARALLAPRPTLCFTPPGFACIHSSQCEGALPHADPDSSALATDALIGGNISAPEGTTLTTPASGEHAVSGRGNNAQST
ncbi:hypothetical protein XENOCAPTIV_026962, partial [Xenoophorus captivus]